MMIRHLAPALLLLVTGCWVPLERGRQMDARLDHLQVQVAEQNDRLDKQSRTLTALVDQKLKEVQVKLDELNRSASIKGADLGAAVARLQEEIVRLRGDLEAQAHQLGQLDGSVKADLRELEVKVNGLRGPNYADETAAKQKLADLPRPDDRGAVLGLARELEKAGDKGVAREVYQHYLRRWPKDDKADEVGLRLGELLSAQGRWKEAVVVLGKVAEEHPKSDHAGPALLLVAEGLVQLDRKDDAHAILEQVVSEHPKSDAAAKAKVRLAELFPSPKDGKKPGPKKK